MRIPASALRAIVNVPAVLASLLLAAVFLAATPPTLQLPGVVALIAMPALLELRRLECAAIGVLWWARPASASEAAALTSARAQLGEAGVEIGVVYVQRRRSGGTVVEAVGHRGAVVVDRQLLEAVHTGAVSTNAAAALIAHAVGSRRTAMPRCDIALVAVTTPWRILGHGAARLARAGAGHPLLTLAWRLRGLAGVGCVLATPAGQAPAAWLGGAVVGLGYLVPAAQRELARRAEAAGDELVIRAGLGAALADLLRRRGAVCSAERIQRLTALARRPRHGHLYLVRV